MEADKFIDEMIEYLKEDIEEWEADKHFFLPDADLEKNQSVCEDYILADKHILELLEHYKTTKEGPKEYYKTMIEKITSSFNKKDK